MEDCKRLEEALKKASHDDKDALMLHAPEILRGRGQYEESNAIRFETMKAVHRLFKTGYRPAESKWLVDLCTFALADSYEHVSYGLQDIVRDFPRVFVGKPLKDLCTWKCKTADDFARLGGEKRFGVVQANFRKLSAEIEGKVAEKIAETQREIVEIEAGRHAFAERLKAAAVADEEKLLNERLEALREKRSKEEQIKDRFSLHFPALREKLRPVAQELKLMEPLKRSLERCTGVFR
jgi:hypothetical protein